MRDCSTISFLDTVRVAPGVILLLAVGVCRAGGVQIERSVLPAPGPAGSRAVNALGAPVVKSLPADARIRLNPSNGTIEIVKGGNLSAFLDTDAQFRQRVSSGQWGEASLYFLQALGARVRLDDPSRELEVRSVDRDGLGYRHVRLDQRYAGLPVFGGEIIVHWNSQGAIYLVNGDYAPTPSGLSPRPTLDRATALAIAESMIAAPCPDCVPQLGVFKGGAAGARLAYRLRIPQGISKVWLITLDAHTGEALEKILVPR